MKQIPRPILLGSVAVAGMAVAVAAGAGIGAGLGSASAAAERDFVPAASAATSFPGLAVADADTPTLPGLASAAPPAGAVVQAAGPFDDRFLLHDLEVSDSAVTGTLEVTSDVSELIELEVIAGFYDADGALLGENSFVLHGDEEEHSHAGPPEEEHEFTVPVPASLAGQAVSAAVGVPVLVNE